MQFLYAIQEQSHISDETLKELGLDFLCGAPQRGVVSGPSGTACQIISRDASRIKYETKKQIWQKSTTGDYWVGYWIGEKVDPVKLERDLQLSGIMITLGDGNKWRIPTARMITGGTILPQSICYSNRKMKYKVKSQYIDFYNAGERLCQYICGEDVEFSDVDMLDIVYQAIMLNYNVGFDEINILELVSTDLFSAITFAIIGEDLTTKKKRLSQRCQLWQLGLIDYWPSWREVQELCLS